MTQNTNYDVDRVVAINRAKAVDRDKRVEVVGGLKWRGVIGRVFWIGESKFGGINAGIVVADCPELRSGCLPEKIFCPINQLEVLDWEQYMPGAKLIVKKKVKV